MLNLLKIFFEFDKRKQERLLLRNRQRFDSIHCDENKVSLHNIYERITNSVEPISNEEILETYYIFSRKQQSNSFAIAELLLVSISTICYYKPELTSILIREGLMAVVASWGDKINFSNVIEFIQYHILGNDATPYGGWPQPEGIKWLTEILPNISEEMQLVLEDVIKKNREELEAI